MLTAMVLKGALHLLRVKRSSIHNDQDTYTLMDKLLDATLDPEKPIRHAAIKELRRDPELRAYAMAIFNDVIHPAMNRAHTREELLERILTDLETRYSCLVGTLQRLGKSAYGKDWSLRAEAEKAYTSQQHEAYMQVFHQYANPTNQS